MSGKLPHLPGTQVKPWLRRRVTYEWLSMAVALSAASRLLYVYWSALPPKTNWLEDWSLLLQIAVLCVLLFLGVNRILDAREQDQQHKPQHIHEGLSGVTHMLHAAVEERRPSVDPVDGLRVTFHRVVPPVKNPQQLEQIVPYCGKDGGGEGRKFSVNTGITGRAIRNHDPCVLSCSNKDEANLRSVLVNEWGYTKEAARALTPGRFSAMAVPVLDQGQNGVVGVIYMDSPELGYFEDRQDGFEQTVLSLCDSVTRYVNRSYAT